MTQENQEYRFKYLEKKVDSHDDSIKELTKMSTEFTKISTILEIQTEMNKKQDETLTKINDNLTMLNQKSDSLDKRVEGLEEDVRDVKQKDTISLSGTIRKVAWKVAGVVIVAITAFCLAYFGL